MRQTCFGKDPSGNCIGHTMFTTTYLGMQSGVLTMSIMFLRDRDCKPPSEFKPHRTRKVSLKGRWFSKPRAARFG